MTNLADFYGEAGDGHLWPMEGKLQDEQGPSSEPLWSFILFYFIY